MSKKLLHNTYLIWKIKPRLARAQFLVGLWYRTKLCAVVIITLPIFIIGRAMEIAGNWLQEIAHLPAISDSKYKRIFKICARAYKNKIIREKNILANRNQ